MFRSILVPLNGSRFAEAALPIASRLARGARARLHLVLAHQPVAALVGMGEAIVPPSGLDEDLRAEEESYLAQRATDLRGQARALVEYAEVDGPAGPAICEEAIRLHADLIVMATHGRGAVGRLALGSVADYVVRHLAVPILLVRPGQPQPKDDKGRGILVALDLSPHSEAILEPVIALARLGDAHVTLVHVLDPSAEPEQLTAPGEHSTSPGFARAEAQRRLDRLADCVRERGVSASARILVGLNVAGSLREALKDSRFDMMAMTTHGAGAMRRLVLGSVAGQLLCKATKPLLLLRPRRRVGPRP